MALALDPLLLAPAPSVALAPTPPPLGQWHLEPVPTVQLAPMALALAPHPPRSAQTAVLAPTPPPLGPNQLAPVRTVPRARFMPPHSAPAQLAVSPAPLLALAMLATMDPLASHALVALPITGVWVLHPTRVPSTPTHQPFQAARMPASAMLATMATAPSLAPAPVAFALPTTTVLVGMPTSQLPVPQMRSLPLDPPCSPSATVPLVTREPMAQPAPSAMQTSIASVESSPTALPTALVQLAPTLCHPASAMLASTALVPLAAPNALSTPTAPQAALRTSPAQMEPSLLAHSLFPQRPAPATAGWLAETTPPAQAARWAIGAGLVPPLLAQATPFP